MGNKNKTLPTTDQVAGNGLLHRRVFLKQGLGFGLVAMTSALTSRASTAQDTTGAIDPARPPWM